MLRGPSGVWGGEVGCLWSLKRLPGLGCVAGFSCVSAVFVSVSWLPELLIAGGASDGPPFGVVWDLPDVAVGAPSLG